MSYTEAMQALSAAAHDAVRAALNEDGAPVEALKLLASDADCLCDHGCTRAEMRDMQALYEGAKRAGLTGGGNDQD